MKSKEKALLVADIAKAKKAENIVILDMRKFSNITDYFVIVTASSVKQSQTIIEHSKEHLIKKKQALSGIDGFKEGEWIILDAFDVVLHVFENEVRKFYDLENLWSKAPRIKICPSKKKKSSKKISKRK